jgi:Tol biopolymer transport system component
MTAERWARLRELFHEALDVDPAARATLLSRVAAGEPDLHAELATLLRNHYTGGAFLELAAQTPPSAPLPPDPPEGTVVCSRYRIVKLLGRGGCSVVFLAEDERIGRRVVLKLLDPRCTGAEWFQKRFRREIEILVKLDHPAIVAAHDCGELPGGRPFLIMDFVDGITLRERLRTPIAVAEAADILLQLGAALAEAHRLRIFHLDLKPENIMLQKSAATSRACAVKLIDFGIAKIEHSGATATTALFVAGTAQYMAPEQFYGAGGAAADVYALAVICCEILTGRTPFDQGTAGALEQLPKPVRPLLQAALSFDYTRRPSDIGAFARDLAGALSSPPRSGLRVAAPLAACAAALLLAFLLLRPAPHRRSAMALRVSNLVRLTPPGELALDPAISRDGNWVAYASDRDTSGRTNLWIRKGASGITRRLTDDPEGADQPAFSPDGATIAYHSRSGAIYAVPAAGGTPTKLVDAGQHPSFSPDGAYIAYQKGDIESGHSTVYTLSTSGSGEREMSDNCGAAAGPVWSPSSRYLLFWCKDSGGAQEFGDFWAVPTVPGAAIATGAVRILAAQGLRPPFETQTSFTPEAWVGDRVLFPARKGNQRGLWSIRIPESTAHAEGPAEFLETGAADGYAASVAAPSAARRTIAFSTQVSNPDLWRLRLGADGSAIAGGIERLTTSPATDRRASVSSDGKSLAFISDRTGEASVWFMDLRTGSQRQIVSGMDVKLSPRLSPDGSLVVFTTERNRQRTVWVAGTAAGSRPHEICTACGYPRAWWPDGRHILLDPIYDPPYDFSQIEVGFSSSFRNIDTGQEDRIRTQIYCTETKISPDGGWAVVGAGAGGSPPTERVLAIPLKKSSTGVPVVPPVHEWIPISDKTAFNAMPVWGAGGTIVYFVSNCDGHLCIWARRVNPRTKRPIGPSFAVYHSHDARLSLDNLGDSVGIDPAAASGNLIFAQAERTGSIWLASLQ